MKMEDIAKDLKKNGKKVETPQGTLYLARKRGISAPASMVRE